MSRQDGIALYAHPNPQSGYSAELNTKPITGDFTERLYQGNVSMKRENAEALSVSNDELRQESRRERTNTAFDFMFDLADIVPFGKIAKGFKALGRLAKPRKLLDKLPGSRRLVTKTDDAGEIVFESARRGNGSAPGPSLKEYEIPVSSDTLKGLKYNKADDIYTDAANNQYLRIGNHWYRTDLQPGADGKMQRGIFRGNDRTDRIDVERFGDRWAVKQKNDGMFEGSNAASSTSTATPPQSSISTLVDNLTSGGKVFDKDGIRSNIVKLTNSLSANGNEQTFSNLMNIMLRDKSITPTEYSSILSIPDPYKRATELLDVLRIKDPGVIAKFPDQLRHAVSNGDEAASATRYLSDLASQNQAKLSNFPDELASGGAFDGNKLRAKSHDLEVSLSANGNEQTFSNLMNIMLRDKSITPTEYSSILSIPDPYKRAIELLDVLRIKDPGVIAKFPDQLRHAV
ncbi:hypothetical protein, partial [Burkholderia ubonensis]|uniref:hypothetical protein n=1 Tax=Burkholderia ubonensis TaxID=101571 RepID=UPI0012FC740A